MKTNWSSPKTNILHGINDLRRALASGRKARLIRLRNEDCEYPIKVKEEDKDFRNYEFSVGYGSSVAKIKADPSRSEFEKYLSLNYVSVFGSDEAMKRYYETGEVDKGNFYNCGRNHLVKASDLIAYYKSIRDYRHANLYEKQYNPELQEKYPDNTYMFDFFRYKHGSPYAIKNFSHKLWVVELLDKEEKQPKLPVLTKILMTIITVLVYPLKYVPRKSVLCMPEYRVITYRIGSVVNGYEAEFQIPKKFSFK